MFQSSDRISSIEKRWEKRNYSLRKVQRVKAKISTTIKTNENTMWMELQKIASLMHVASPILKFKPQKGSFVSEKWVLGSEYKFKLYLFGIIPIGDHFIKLAELNQEENKIVSHERGSLVKVWNHTIKWDAIDDQTIVYTDGIEISAGIMTLSIWLFAHIFYRHRQKKWNKLLEG